MLNRLSIITLFALLSCSVCLGQSSFMGLTPGKSTRADVERVLGRPVKNVSETLVEYAPRQLKLIHAGVTSNSGKIYVQYRDGSPTAVVERIEQILCARSTKINDECNIPSMH